MKKLLFLLCSGLLVGCSCMLSQIPSQYIFAGEGCTAPLPDYKTQVVVTGGCTGFTVTQTPLPGFLLTAVNKEVTVEIKAVGTNLKSSKVSFLVTMLDTLTPKITPLPSLMTYQQQQLKDIYDAGDKIAISMFKEFDKAFPWSDTIAYAPGAGPMTDSVYNDMMLLNVSSDSLGFRSRHTLIVDTNYFDKGHVTWEEILYKPTDFPTSIHIHGWEQISHPTYLDEDALRHPVDNRDFYDWMAYGEYIPIPLRAATSPPNMDLVHVGYNFAPLIYDQSVKKLKFWNGVAWKTITSN